MDDKLSRREREIMDILLKSGECTAEEVRQRLTDPPSYSTARVMLTRLEKKGFIRHKEKGMRYVYSVAVPRARAQKSAVNRLIDVFYDGSLAKAVTGMVESGEKLSDDELDAIEAAIAAARKQKRHKS